MCKVLSVRIQRNVRFYSAFKFTLKRINNLLPLRGHQPLTNNLFFMILCYKYFLLRKNEIDNFLPYQYIDQKIGKLWHCTFILIHSFSFSMLFVLKCTSWPGLGLQCSNHVLQTTHLEKRDKKRGKEVTGKH